MPSVFRPAAALLPALLAALIARPAAGADLLVDFNSTNQEGGPHNMSGYQPYNAGHEVAADFLAARTYSAFNTTVSLKVTWPDTTNVHVQQMIDRTAGNDAYWVGQKLDLLTDFIGIDTRTAEGGRGNYDGVTGLPTRMIFRLTGLPTGPYSYRSYHHDTENLNTPFIVEYSTNGGTSYTTLSGGPFRMTDSSPGGTPASAQTYTGTGNQDPATLPSTINFNLVAQAGQDVLVRYTPYSYAAGTHVQLFGVNGFELRAVSPPSGPTDIALAGSTIARTAVEGTVVGNLSTTDPTPADTFTYSLAEGLGSDNNADFSIEGNTLVVERQLSEYNNGQILSVRIRSTDANAGWFEKIFTLQVVNDSDADGLDDTWELLHFQNLNQVASGNPDNDGLTNLEELQAGTDPLNHDTDDDGLWDGPELKQYFTNPLSAHSDGDGLTDREEVLQYFTDPNDPDSDHDGYDDAFEISQGTNPKNSSDHPPFPLPLRINEVLASNGTGLSDGNGDESDWIEIYNPNPSPVNLQGYRLTDSALEPGKWVFPSVQIGANSYLVVFASGSGVPDAMGKLHTNFALSADGEYLALSRPNGSIDDQFSSGFPAQFTDVSYGRHPTSGALRYFSPPTPGAANGSGYEGVVAPPAFWVGRGFYDTAQNVSLSCPTPLAQIRYTADGSKPNVTTGTIYSGAPISVTTTSKLRAISYRSGWLSQAVQTHSYVFVNDVAHQPANPPGWPTNWGYSSDAGATVPSDYEMDPRVVNSTLPGYSIRDALLDIPSVSINMPMADFIEPPGGIYASPLDRVEKECSVEYLPVDGSQGFQTDCKVEIQGNASRRPARMQKHSLRLTFSSAIGIPKLDFPLFPNSPVTKFNKLVLRACFSDSWGLVSWDSPRYRPNDAQYMRDVWMKRSFGDMGQPTSYGRYVHLYVNGLYFGLHDFTERLEDDFYAEHLGGRSEDWEVNADFATGSPRWTQMMAIANSANISTPAGLASIQPYIDLENFADYMILHFYGDAEDWPHHNGYAAANAISGDGKFRFSVWDQEIALNKFTWNRYSTNPGNNTAGTLFQRLRLNPGFRLIFADRVKKAMFDGGALTVAKSGGRYLNIAAQIDKAIVAESARWGDTADKTPYGSTIAQPVPLNNLDSDNYPPAPHASDPGGIYFTREDSWLVERDLTVNYYIPIVNSSTDSRGLIQELRANNLYPALDAPTFSQHGGILPPAQPLSITAPLGDIYYTINGSDPADPATGNPAAGSTLYTAPFTLPSALTVKARARLSDGTWSALLAASFQPEQLVAEFIPGGSESWNVDANWTNPPYPNSSGARARILAPASGDRNIDLIGATTVGELVFEQGSTTFRNRVRDQFVVNPLSFQSAQGNALLRVNGSGTGWVEFELASQCTLNSPLTVEVNNIVGNKDFGALRLRTVWNGSGGLTKTGPGLASLTGEGKLYTGPTLISQGVLAVSAPATMTASSSVTVSPGGQLRLTSTGTPEEPGLHAFGGPIQLSGMGRSGVVEGAGMGVLGALRYDPGNSENYAKVTNPIAFAGASDLHVDGSDNHLELGGTLSGNSGWVKSGGGVLRLSGNSPSYLGAIQVDNGSLELAGNLGSAIQLASGTSLSGYGHSGALTGSGSLLVDRGILHADSLSGLAATFVFSQTGSPDFSQTANAGNGTLVADQLSGPISSLTLYLDLASLQAGDRLRGGLLLPPGSDWQAALVESAPQVFAPDDAGGQFFNGRTWSLVSNARLTRVPITVNLGQGNINAEILEVRLDGAPTHFAAWQAAAFTPAQLGNPAISGENAAPFGDGVPNLLRYALGTSGAGQVSLPELVRNGGSASFRFRYNPALFDLVYQVEATTNLSDWSNPVILFNSTSSSLQPSPDGYLTITDPSPLQIRRFYRLRVIRQAP
ncbi:chitobiase/beta-hexosaminidase C-terminal domain-containing protein [Haloferula sp. BvORR071]|uniref:chitobiase/beta-hexosaminidase C-terminal domain-containing protein n=1 Tax=Haloferula sp. BvORR071 TaxID=1396141 RepID=UPI00054DAEB8|nr:chitobiase/beta-hexosaminidase C-terminal domain-containing protein [Haloferula sp. BvORR071]